MKSAWEIALERSGGALRELSAEKKEQIAELTRATQAKLAAAKLSAEQQIAKSEDAEEIAKIKDRLTYELNAIQDASQRKKDEIRNS